MSGISRRGLFGFLRGGARAPATATATASAPATAPAPASAGAAAAPASAGVAAAAPASAVPGMVAAGNVFSLDAFYAGRAQSGAVGERPPPAARRAGLPSLPASRVGTGQSLDDPERKA